MSGWKIPLLWISIAIAIAMLAQFETIVVWTDLHSGFASWVQAVGSVLAILAAAVIAGWQTLQTRNADREKERRDRLNKFLAIRGILVHTDACFQIAVTELGNRSAPKVWERLGEEVSQARSVLASLPILDLPGPYAAIRLGLTEQNLRALNNFCTDVEESDPRFDKQEITAIFEEWRSKSANTLKWFLGQVQENSTIEEMREIVRLAREQT
ncbi:hypothetical protein PMI15_04320 [Polaromonas sp. CF318]|uniref:hypothetical protein n=1 Tax=Polaromonas sp. CF318 TaxID=1144318 RepID=UPI000270FA17|nr:hypothetical protein [Polaromonas sp. CF318]EJL78471.1 hypothetical protein PMI15_04320 [Polaromonas sp. CF318]